MWKRNEEEPSWKEEREVWRWDRQGIRRQWSQQILWKGPRVLCLVCSSSESEGSTKVGHSSTICLLVWFCSDQRSFDWFSWHAIEASHIDLAKTHHHQHQWKRLCLRLCSLLGFVSKIFGEVEVRPLEAALLWAVDESSSLLLLSPLMEKGFFGDVSVKFVVVLTHCEQEDEDRDRGETGERRETRGETKQDRTRHALWLTDDHLLNLLLEIVVEGNLFDSWLLLEGISHEILLEGSWAYSVYPKVRLSVHLLCDRIDWLTHLNVSTSLRNLLISFVLPSSSSRISWAVRSNFVFICRG